MGLEEYHRRRDFERTPEPVGQEAAAEPFAFVIQKHAARRLHYDFRLELDGVLLSWAVPKGPSLDPSKRRLAVHTEDHPAEYGGFEGIIPAGEYGGGTVIVWDRGRWEPLGDPRAMYAGGRLTFRLHGERLHGIWHLVRTSGDDDKSWLLIKSRDEAAERDGEIVEAEQASVVSGRTLEAVADEPESVWRSNRPRAGERGADGEEHDEGGEWRPPVRLTHPNKVLWPGQGITKLDLARHYADVAELMLPHVAGRPLTLFRCPEGHHKECFFQKQAYKGLPKAVHPVEVPEGPGGKGIYTYVDDVEGLLGLVQIGVLEIHVWGSRRDRLERADQLVFDLDPDPDVSWEAVVDATRHVKARLDELGLESFLKTTGGKGLHVVAPIARRTGWAEVKAFSRGVVESLRKDLPDRYTTSLSKSKRKGRIFLDYLRNGRGATAVCVYSTRARPGAPVSVPLRWDELSTALRSDRYNVRNLRRRLASVEGDPWEGFVETKQSINARMRRAVGLE